MPTIREKIIEKANDYLAIEKMFKKKTGLELVSFSNQSYDVNKINAKASVIIPSYVGERINLVLKSLEMQTYKNFEVIIVDDASPVRIENIIEKEDLNLSIKLIRNIVNKGRPLARNIGLSAAENEIIITMDQDMVVKPDFVANFVLRQQYTDDCVFIGFRENIEYEDFLLKKNDNAKIEKDWRYFQANSDNFIPLFSPIKNKIEPRDYSLLRETEMFRNFGNGKTVGYWDLPSMVISHSLSFKKKDAISAGGFQVGIFNGWGVEDLAFGASLIAHGKYIIPTANCVSYHINHKRYSGSREAEWNEFLHNLEIYFEFLDKSLISIKYIDRRPEFKGKFKNITLYEVS